MEKLEGHLGFQEKSIPTVFLEAERAANVKEEWMMELPKCQKCNNGVLIPLSDYGQDGASVIFKAWVCTNPECGFSLRVDKGEVTFGKKVEHKH